MGSAHRKGRLCFLPSFPSSPPVLVGSLPPTPSLPFLSARLHIHTNGMDRYNPFSSTASTSHPVDLYLPPIDPLELDPSSPMPVQLGGGKLAEPRAAVDLSPTQARSSSARKNRRRQKKASPPAPMQSLFDTSREVFSASSPGFVPPPDAVARLSAILNDLTPHDVGIDSSMPCFKHGDSKGPPRVTYLHFYDCPKFSFGIFCLPKSAVIPLHNHPGMTVFSKILFGSMHLKSYDWATSLPDSNAASLETLDGARLAKVNTDAVFDASAETVVLYPENGGNLHCFTALTPCAVLDVMGPPYNRADGRDCAYYSEATYSTSCGRGERYSWLKEIPSTFEMKGIQMAQKFVV